MIENRLRLLPGLVAVLGVLIISSCVSADHGVQISPGRAPSSDDTKAFLVQRLAGFSSDPASNVQVDPFARAYWAARILQKFNLGQKLDNPEQVLFSRALFDSVPKPGRLEGLFQVIRVPDFYQSGEELILQNQVYAFQWHGQTYSVLYLVSNALEVVNGISHGQAVMNTNQFYYRLVVTPQGGLVDLQDWLQVSELQSPGLNDSAPSTGQDQLLTLRTLMLSASQDTQTLTQIVQLLQNLGSENLEDGVEVGQALLQESYLWIGIYEQLARFLAIIGLGESSKVVPEKLEPADAIFLELLDDLLAEELLALNAESDDGGNLENSETSGTAESETGTENGSESPPETD